MRYIDFENIITPTQMGRYKNACGSDTRKAMTLYRKNLKLSQKMFTVISCFEIALRNSIDKLYTANLGNDWLKNAVAQRGNFDNSNFRLTKKTSTMPLSNLGLIIHTLNLWQSWAMAFGGICLPIISLGRVAKLC